ncbi:hypothetical protein INR49_008057 [Caranx melampygus]|nr:hypothetical protein INR49_008057 [Caranx melampygus]
MEGANIELALKGNYLIESDLLQVPVLNVEEQDHAAVLVPAGQNHRVTCLDGAADRLGGCRVDQHHSPFRSSWALTTSNFRALRNRSIRESGLSPKRSRTSLARSSPSAALSFIMARRSFSDDARLSSIMDYLNQRAEQPYLKLTG